MSGQNVFGGVPANLPEEFLETLLQTPGLRIERIVSRGHASPEGFWYDQEGGEWVIVLAGAARLTIEGKPPLELRPGDYVDLPPHTRHRVDWTDPGQDTVWLAVHYGGSR